MKLRPVEPGELPKKLRADPGFGVEVDAMPGKLVCSGTLKAPADNAAINRVIAGKRPLRKLLTPTQQALFDKHSPEHIDLDALVPLSDNAGQAQVLARRLQAPDGGGDVVLPQRHAHPRALDQVHAGRGGGRPRERPSAAGGPGRAAEGQQQTKTRAALQYFSKLAVAQAAKEAAEANGGAAEARRARRHRQAVPATAPARKRAAPPRKPATS